MLPSDITSYPFEHRNIVTVHKDDDDSMNVNLVCRTFDKCGKKIQEALTVHPATRERAEVCWKECNFNSVVAISDVFFS